MWWKEIYLATLPWYEKIGVIQQNRELEQLYRALTQKHTQKLANMVLGEYDGKPKDEIRNQVYCQEWEKSKNIKCPSDDHYKHGKYMEHTHGISGVSATKSERKSVCKDARCHTNTRRGKALVANGETTRFARDLSSLLSFA